MDIVIRSEIESDIKAISEITKALTISLVAVAGKKVVGHIAFSPVTFSDGSLGWYGLGPISVLPELQKQGIGKSFLCESLSVLKSLGAKGCVLVGDPGNYERFGFRSQEDLTIDGVPQENVLALSFEESTPSGTVLFHEGFNARG